jgi:hypothetical protein
MNDRSRFCYAGRVNRLPTSRLAVLALAVLAAVATACGGTTTTEGSSSTTLASAKASTTAPAQLFASDFEDVCQGATVASATAYDPAAPTHKVVLLSTYDDSMIEDTTTLPADWQVTFDAEANAYAEVDLVACAVRTEATFVQDCTGYESDGVVTENVAKLHNATYELTVREATTGTSLGTTTVTTADQDCPMFVMFESDTETRDYFASPPADEVTAFVKPFAQP